MDNYLLKKQSYFDHILIDLEIYNFLKEYPEYKELINWFNARSSFSFLHEMVKRNDFSHKERKNLFNKAKLFLSDASEDTLSRFSSFQRELLNDVKTKSYWRFFLKYKLRYPQIKRKLLLSYQRILKTLDILMLVFISLFYRLNPKNRDIWIFSERPSEAKDNGYRFFQYINENHPEINSYYLIDESNEKDYGKIKKIGNTLQYGSLKHKLYFILSKKLVAAHKDVIEPWNYGNFKKYFHKITPAKKYIFLQHGITKDDVSNILGKKNPNSHFDLFICGAKPEYDFITNNFGYLPCEVVYTGFARFDYLHNTNTKNQILIMPTWRKGIVQPSWVKHKIVDDEDFLNSEYYITYQNLINNKELINILNENGFKLIFYPHYEVQQYLKYFTSKNPNIIIADCNSYDVQTLLIESKLLITDFSSVYFDFAYMNKPLAYYQFDKEFFFKNHYKKGYFSYENHGFGPVIESEEDLINFLESAFQNNFSMDPEYRTRTDDFFVLKDDRNCERIYNEIMKLDQHYIVVDSLIDGIFKDHKQKLSFNRLDIYLHGNYMMYVSDSITRVKNKFFLEVSHDSEDFHEAPGLLNLDFFFEDLRVAEDKRSRHNDKNIAIVKIPKVKIKSIKMGQYINEEVKNLGEFCLNEN